jgi:chaperonin GroES
MKPLGDQVLLQEKEKKEKTTSGIILMNGAEGSYVMADVIAVGEGLFTQTGDRIPMTIKVGDVVMIHKNDTTENKKIKIDNQEYVLVRESDIAMYQQ